MMVERPKDAEDEEDNQDMGDDEDDDDPLKKNRIIVFFPDNDKFNNDDLISFLKKMVDAQSYHSILVLKGNLTPIAKQVSNMNVTY